IDMQKAYNSVEWIFIEQVLQGLHYPAKFISWIMTCLKTVSYSISINGKPSSPFAAKWGIRQGDPIPPYMFTLVMEYLSRLLKRMSKNPTFKSHPKCAKLNITQLGFAGDLLLFCKADKFSVQLLSKCFQDFSHASGPIAHPTKSSVYFALGVLEHQILDLLGFSKGMLPFIYLGVPLSSKRLSITQCQLLMDTMLGKITSWTSKFLSYTGRVMLNKSVLFAIETYWSQVFVL
ncbi:hypothetical protein A4A49_64304, partial [Nicotiana attenuata]